MKALEKDRTRRYDTANGLAADVLRYLGNEPIAARPPGALYRFTKFVRRNRVAVTAAGAILAALILGLGLSTWMYFRANAAAGHEAAAKLEQTRHREGADAERGRGESESRQAKANPAIAQIREDRPTAEAILEPVWKGPREDHKADWPGSGVRLFQVSWTNPDPGSAVERVDFESTMQWPAPFLIAITSEP